MSPTEAQGLWFGDCRGRHGGEGSRRGTHLVRDGPGADHTGRCVPRGGWRVSRHRAGLAAGGPRTSSREPALVPKAMEGSCPGDGLELGLGEVPQDRVEAGQEGRQEQGGSEGTAARIQAKPLRQDGGVGSRARAE